jgi:hypothetical protein
MDEADLQPAGDQGGLPIDDRLEKRKRRFFGVRELGIVAANCMGEQRRGERGIADGCCILKRANADVAGRHTDKHGAWEGILTEDCFASCGDGEAPRRGNPEGVHRLTDEDLAEHRPERRPAVSTA